MREFYYQTIDPKAYSVLGELMANPQIKANEFVLCGGGALALHLGHRQSTDLDLFTNRSIGPDQMQQVLSNMFSDRLSLYNQSELGVRAFVDGVKLDMIRFPYDFQHPVVNSGAIRFLEKEDAIAMKLHAVAGRGLRRDFYDLAEILQKVPLSQALLLYKNQFNPSPTAMNHTMKALTYFGDAEKDSNKIDIKNGRTWDQVRRIVQQSIQQPNRIHLVGGTKLIKPENPHERLAKQPAPEKLKPSQSRSVSKRH